MESNMSNPYPAYAAYPHGSPTMEPNHDQQWRDPNGHDSSQESQSESNKYPSSFHHGYHPNSAMAMQPNLPHYFGATPYNGTYGEGYYGEEPNNFPHHHMNGADSGQHHMYYNGVVSPPTGDAPKGTKAKKRKKPKDKPKRPLSAYNLFFREERSKLLNDGENVNNANKKDEQGNTDEITDDGNKENGKSDKESNATDTKADCSAKGQGKKPVNGKVGFESMAKIISKRWKEISEERLTRFKALASVDTERYKKEMLQYNAKLEQEKSKEKAQEKIRKREHEEAFGGDPTKAGTERNWNNPHQESQDKKKDQGKRNDNALPNAYGNGMGYGHNMNAIHHGGMPMGMGMHPNMQAGTQPAMGSQHQYNSNYHHGAMDNNQPGPYKPFKPGHNEDPTSGGGGSNFGNNPYGYSPNQNYSSAPTEYSHYGGNPRYNYAGQHDPSNGNISNQGHYNPQKQQMGPHSSGVMEQHDNQQRYPE